MPTSSVGIYSDGRAALGAVAIGVTIQIGVESRYLHTHIHPLVRSPKDEGLAVASLKVARVTRLAGVPLDLAGLADARPDGDGGVIRRRGASHAGGHHTPYHYARSEHGDPESKFSHRVIVGTVPGSLARDYDPMSCPRVSVRRDSRCSRRRAPTPLRLTSILVMHT